MRVSLMLLSFMLSVVPHESNPSSKVPCISADAPVYMMERDIKPLSPNRQERKEGPRNSRWNVAGTVDQCRGARLRDASRQCLRSIGRAKTAKFITKHGTFKPATKQGKVVAVRFTMRFNMPR